MNKGQAGHKWYIQEAAILPCTCGSMADLKEERVSKMHRIVCKRCGKRTKIYRDPVSCKVEWRLKDR